MDTWHEIAWEKWREETARGLSKAIRAALKELDVPKQAVWMTRLRQQITPCAKVMAQYLHGGEKTWAVAAGLVWDRIETSQSVFIAYPEPLGDDPLAMAALGLIWAGQDVNRLQIMVEKLGAAALFAGYDGQLTMANMKLTVLWTSYLQNFGLDGISPEVQQFFEETTGQSGGDKLNWGVMPAYQTYLDQLVYGVVPHESSGESPWQVPAVLLALHYVPATLRSQAALLAFKAVEGRILTEQWRRAALMDSRDEGDLWS